MKRDERILVAAAGVVAAVFVAIFAVGLENTLANYAWWANGGNVIQWVSGPATVGAIAAFVYNRLVRRCAIPFCVRSGDHPVDGTLSKVCTHHHTREHHELVHGLHGDIHAISGRLGWGETHTEIVTRRRTPATIPFAGKKPTPKKKP